MKMTKFAAMTTALLICAGTMGYMPQTTVHSNITANAAEEATAESVKINEVNFPDAVFRQYVAENFDTDGDCVLISSEIEAVKKIIVNDMEISDLTGVQYFEDLKHLHCRNNNLTEIDLTKNTKLTYFVCSNNKLTTLDVSNNKNLHDLFCNNNQLTSLDLDGLEPSIVVCFENKYEIFSSNNIFDLSTLPSELDISRTSHWACGEVKNGMLKTIFEPDEVTYKYDLGNGESETFTLITTTISAPLKDIIIINEKEFPDAIFRQYVAENFDTDGNEVLTVDEVLDVTEIRVDNMEISDLTGVEYFINLEWLICSENKLTALDVSNNKMLTRLYCEHNPIASLDLSNNTALEYFIAHCNAFSSLDLSKNTFLTNVDISFNDCEILLKDNTFDLSNLPAGFDIAKVSEWGNATVEGNILTVKNPQYAVSYTYDCGNGISTIFYLYPVISAEVPKGDINDNGSIDSSDATLILSDYAALAVGDTSTFTNEQSKAADLNGDGKYDAIDASLILAYYAHTSTGGTGSIEEFIENMSE